MPKRIKLAIDEQTKSKDLSGRVYIVTGANSGVGLETTRQLIKQGAHVVMACRRVDAGEREAQSFAELKGSHEVMKCDLADLQSVRSFVDAFLKKYDRLDGLDCNAGLAVMSNSTIPRTKDGFELSIGVSYFGHFLLTELLLDILKKSAPSRIVLLSSVVHSGRDGSRPDIHFEDLNYNTRKYAGLQAYTEAKVANILYAKELAKRLEGTGVTAYSVHPGWARSNFGRNSALMRVLSPIMGPLTRSMSDSNEESAQTSLHCLISDDAPKHSGAYFSQSSVLYNDKALRNGGWSMESPNPNARDMNKAKKLVEMSYHLVGLK